MENQTEEIALGTTLTYKKGDIVFCGGNESALGRLDRDFDFSEATSTLVTFKDYLNNIFRSFRCNLLRPASEAEKEILGDREFIRFSPYDEQIKEFARTLGKTELTSEESKRFAKTMSS